MPTKLPDRRKPERPSKEAFLSMMIAAMVFGMVIVGAMIAGMFVTSSGNRPPLQPVAGAPSASPPRPGG